jgi:hypothetical protein
LIGRAAIAAVLLTGLVARAEAPRWAPTIGVSMGAFDEQVKVVVDGAQTNSTRGQLRLLLFVGLAHPVAGESELVWLDGHASLGAGPTFETGHWHAVAREDVSLAVAVASWMTVRVGLGVGFTFDTTATARSDVELAVPVGVTLFKVVEVAYRPMLVLPVGREQTAVLGGTRTLSTRLAVLPFEVALRFRIGALGW